MAAFQSSLWLRAGVACLLLALALPLAAADRPVAEMLDLNPDALVRFVELQDGWLEWLAAAHQGDANRAAAAADQLLADAQALGLQRLPDLSLGAAGRAIGFARDGRFDVAGWCLELAERFDPGRSEVAFAAATVAQLDGNYLAFFRQSFEANSRLFKDRLLRRLWQADLGHWIIFVLLATGALYVAILMATKGIELFHDVHSFVDKFVPEIVALGVTLILLVWPILLPSGLLWLLVYWSILLWAYSSSSQKIILAGLWIVLGAAPILINEQRQHIRVALAPTVLTMESLANGRLQGSLFGDLATLRSTLPDSTAVAHLLADLHCELEEWESARALYESLVEREPKNGTALLNLGVCYLHLEDKVQAMENFQKAASTDEAAAAARFNMSQVLSELYRFREAERELRVAQRLAPRQVGEWIRRTAEERVVTLGGGLVRAAEIRDDLVSSWEGDSPGGRRPGVWPRVLSLPLAVAFLVIAIGLHFIVRRGGESSYSPAEPMAPPGTWRGILLPGLSEAENDHPLWAWLVVLIVVLLLSLPLAPEVGYRLTWIYSPGTLGVTLLSTIGLAIFLLVRVAWHRGRKA